MRYLVKARVKPGREKALLGAIDDGSLGRGSIAGDEYVYDMHQAGLLMATFIGLKPASAISHSKRSGRIGRNTSSGCK
jgi:hypothetical protein